ncbi:MAG: hypothetical protein ACJA13_003553 [Paraglaciecola sp.]|jgi:hypothetical protein
MWGLWPAFKAQYAQSWGINYTKQSTKVFARLATLADPTGSQAMAAK